MIEHTNNHLMLGEKTYNVGKQLVQIILPATASLYYGLAIIWGLPAAEEVVGSLAVITTFLGVVLGVSNRQYQVSGAQYDGQMVIIEPEVEGEKTVFSLELNQEAEDFANKKAITFQVQKSEPPRTELV